LGWPARRARPKRPYTSVNASKDWKLLSRIWWSPPLSSAVPAQKNHYATSPNKSPLDYGKHPDATLVGCAALLWPFCTAQNRHPTSSLLPPRPDLSCRYPSGESSRLHRRGRSRASPIRATSSGRSKSFGTSPEAQAWLRSSACGDAPPEKLARRGKL
jgi:hypothetical protein